MPGDRVGAKPRLAARWTLKKQIEAQDAKTAKEKIRRLETGPDYDDPFASGRQGRGGPGHLTMLLKNVPANRIKLTNNG